MRIGDGRDEVGGTRTARRHADADATGGRGVALGGVAGGLLVTDEDVADLGGVHERVVCREDRPAGNAEDDIDVGVLHRPDQALGARDPLTGRLPCAGAHCVLFPLPSRKSTSVAGTMVAHGPL